MSNILKLIRIGFLPPHFTERDLEKTIYYKIWNSFRVYCYFAEIEELKPNPRIRCKKLSSPCNFGECPLIKNAIEEYERDYSKS